MHENYLLHWVFMHYLPRIIISFSCHRGTVNMYSISSMEHINFVKVILEPIDYCRGIERTFFLEFLQFWVPFDHKGETNKLKILTEPLCQYCTFCGFGELVSLFDKLGGKFTILSQSDEKSFWILRHYEIPQLSSHWIVNTQN